LSKRKPKDRTLQEESEDYEVIEPGNPGYGQYYPSYCEQWITWLVSNNPESNNYGPVYFLHCVSCPGEGVGYGNQVVVRVGPDALDVRAGEYIFLPVLTSTIDTIDNGAPDNPAALLNYLRMDLQQGDNPPKISQATILDATDNDVNAEWKPIVSDLAPFFVISDVFQLDVPSAQEGTRLLRTCVDVPMNTEGVRNCRVGGWWLLIRFLKPFKTYYIHTRTKGRGNYKAGMFYQINVLGESENAKLPTASGVDEEPEEDWSIHPIISSAKKLSKDGQLDPETAKFVEAILNKKKRHRK
jgi:hypothetical protein